MHISLIHLDRLTLEFEPGAAVAIDPEEEIRKFLQDRTLSAKPVNRASLFLTEKSRSENLIFADVALPGEGHGDYSAWAKQAGHTFDSAVTMGSFDRIVRRLVEVAASSGQGSDKMRISSNDLKALFSNWMDSTI
jgi:hypothetical protein